MTNLLNVVLDSILKSGNLSSTSSLNSASTNTTSTNTKTPAFSTVLAQLNNNIKFSSLKVQNKDINDYLNTNSANASMPLDIDAIVQKIISEKKNGSTKSVDALIKQYLVKYFGGSEEGVIKKLAGVDSLPTQASALQSQIFDNIVRKISCQVRQKLATNEEYNNLESPDEVSSVSSSTDTEDAGLSLSSDTPYL